MRSSVLLAAALMGLAAPAFAQTLSGPAAVSRPAQQAIGRRAPADVTVVLPVYEGRSVGFDGSTSAAMPYHHHHV